MKPALVFVHGWGFDKTFWQPLLGVLPSYETIMVDCGFFGAPQPLPEISSHHVLVGHSYGFMHGVLTNKNWQATISINSFLRFVEGKSGPACVPMAALRAMRAELVKRPLNVLSAFHRRIGSEMPQGVPQVEPLSAALKELETGDCTPVLGIMPTLVLSGGLDGLVPQTMQQEMAAHCQVCKVHEAAGHLLPLTHPAWCAEAIDAFVQGLPP